MATDQAISLLVKGVQSLVDQQRKEALLKSKTMFSKTKSIEELILEEAMKTNELLDEGVKEDKKKVKIGGKSFQKLGGLAKFAGYGAVGVAALATANQLNKLKNVTIDYSKSLKNAQIVADSAVDSFNANRKEIIEERIKSGIITPEDSKLLSKNIDDLSKVTKEFTSLPKLFGSKFLGTLASEFGIKQKQDSKTLESIGLFNKNDAKLLKKQLTEKFLEVSSRQVGIGSIGGEVLTSSEIVNLVKMELQKENLKTLLPGKITPAKQKDFQGVKLAPNVNINDLDPTFLSNFTTMAKEFHELTGNIVDVNSGFRSVSQQQKLFSAALKKYGSIEEARKHVAPPGKSRHNIGTAIDIQSEDANLLASLGLLKKHGFNRPVFGEAWHIEQIKKQQTSESFAKNSKVNSPSMVIEKKKQDDAFVAMVELNASIKTLPKEIASEINKNKEATKAPMVNITTNVRG